MMRHSVHSIFYDQADQHEADGHYEQALATLYQVHRWAPDDPVLWLRIGVLCFLITDRAWLARHGLEGSYWADMAAVNAELYLQKACSLAPDQAIYAFWHGWVRHALYQNAEGARERLEAALALDSRHPYAHAALARLAMAAEPADPIAAEAHLRAALARLPESPRFHYDLGACLARQNRLEEARAAFRAAEAAPGLPVAPGAISGHLAAEFHGRPEEVGVWARRFYGDVLGNEPFIS